MLEYPCLVLSTQQLWLFSGVVFEKLTGNDLSYKIRLRHEVGSVLEVGPRDSWRTNMVGLRFSLPGPRILNKWVVAVISNVAFALVWAQLPFWRIPAPSAVGGWVYHPVEGSKFDGSCCCLCQGKFWLTLCDVHVISTTCSNSPTLLTG